MKEEGIKLLLEHEDWFRSNKQYWTPTDFKVCYKIYNLLTNQNKADTGCGSCRRIIIQTLRHEYKILNRP